jgi:hypothetical protein
LTKASPKPRKRSTRNRCLSALFLEAAWEPGTPISRLAIRMPLFK